MMVLFISAPSPFHYWLPVPIPDLSVSQVLSVSPELPTAVLLLRQIQCERLLLASAGTALPESVLEQLSNAVMVNPSNLGAWHVSKYSFSGDPTFAVAYCLMANYLRVVTLSFRASLALF